MAVTMKATTVFWDVTWCGLPKIYQHLRQPTGAASRVLQNNEIFIPTVCGIPFHKIVTCISAGLHNAWGTCNSLVNNTELVTHFVIMVKLHSGFLEDQRT